MNCFILPNVLITFKYANYNYLKFESHFNNVTSTDSEIYLLNMKLNLNTSKVCVF